MTATSITLADLQAKRAAAARKADELADQHNRFPHRELREARDAAARLVDAYDRTINSMSGKREEQVRNRSTHQ